MKHNERELKQGDIVQLNPVTTRNPMFRACFLVVDEPKSFGCQGYVQCTGENGEPGGQAYYRASWDEMEYCGRAYWIIGSEINENTH